MFEFKKGEYMKVILIDPTLTMNTHDKAGVFLDIVIQQLQFYAIEYYVVIKENFRLCESKIDGDSLIVLFNDKVEVIRNNKYNVYDFLCRAKDKNISIWAVAMDKDSRIPFDIISKKQSYDVYEQLRSRNLSANYLSVVAKAFSRKIISKVLPTICSEEGLIFVSHRRVDGEETSASLCDRITVQARESNVFRDIINVKVGEEAQDVIDRALKECDAFIFLHTNKSSESDWIQKELRYAILRNIPVLWVQIDSADIPSLKIIPTEEPHLQYDSKEFDDDKRLTEITDEILEKLFELTMKRCDNIFDSLDSLKNLFGYNMKPNNITEMVYSIEFPRKNTRYPQRNIQQYVQLFGRTPNIQDKNRFIELTNTDESEYDSSVILTDRIVNLQLRGKNVMETFDDFYYHWDDYINPKGRNKGMEIVISGAFPDGDEICKQSLTDALVIFAKSILKDGYMLTFGSHPTFQELFFEIAKGVDPSNHNKLLKMYISKWFEEKYSDQKEHYGKHAMLIEIEKEEILSNSLTAMRKQMIERKEVSALVCIGGKIKKNESEEGIRQEMKLAKEYGIPVFVVGSVGGSSSKVAEEYSKYEWKGLNNASIELNKEFMESLDYFSLSQKMLTYLDN